MLIIFIAVLKNLILIKKNGIKQKIMNLVLDCHAFGVYYDSENLLAR